MHCTHATQEVIGGKTAETTKDAPEEELRQEIARLRAQLSQSLQQQQALADFWSVEKQRFGALEAELQRLQRLSDLPLQQEDGRRLFDATEEIPAR